MDFTIRHSFQNANPAPHHLLRISPDSCTKVLSARLILESDADLNLTADPTYWLSIGLNRIIPNKQIPPWLAVSFGYSAGGMFGEFKNLSRYKGQSIPDTERYRQFLLSLDIDFSKIPTRKPALKKLFNSLFLLKVPFPTLEYTTKNEFKFHALYW